MNYILFKFKRNYILRGLHALYKNYFSLRRSKFGKCGYSAFIQPPYNISNPRNIFLEDNVVIGPGAVIYSTLSNVYVKRNTYSGPNLSIFTGGHMMQIGKFSLSISHQDKINQNAQIDKDIYIEEDVWIGANVTILKGVRIGRGAIIAAGSVLTKDAMPYSIVGGMPAKHLKYRWTLEEIIKHEEILYTPDERLTKEYLQYLT